MAEQHRQDGNGWRDGRTARALALGALLALAGCAQPEGVLLPVAAGPEPGTKVNMLVATTRAPSTDPGVVFTGERGSGLALTDIQVSVPPDRPVGSIQWPSRAPGDPAREFVVTRLEPVPRADARRWFKTHGGGKRRVLVFIHGFNTRFDAAVFRYAQFIADTDASLVPVLFSWPSRGRVTDYVYDRESANFSRTDLAYVLQAAARSPDVDEVVVLAHSMGAWLAVEALRELALRDGRVPAKISNVVLASPDLDIDVFERQVADLGPRRPRIVIFTSRNDRALGLSRLIAGQVTRVGAVDVTNPAYAERLRQADGVVVVDLTALEGGDVLNHSAFATQPDMVRLIGARLASGQQMNEPIQPVQQVGGAIGTVVATPITVLAGGRN